MEAADIMNFLKRILSMIFPRDEIKNAFGVDAPPGGVMAAAIQGWAEFYESGRLKIPKAIAGELARLITLELKIDVSGSPRADYLNACLTDELPMLRRELPKGLGYGTMIIKPYYNGQKMCIDCVCADRFVPTSWENGRITGVIFAQKLQRENKYYTRLEQHNFKNGVHAIKNAAFVSGDSAHLGSSVPLTALPEWAKLLPSATVNNVSAPLFGVFRNTAPNTLDPSSPLGVSVFDGAMPIIREAEKLFENLLWEFESGKRRVYVDIAALKPDGKGVPTIKDEIFRSLDVNEDNFFRDWSPEFRNEAMQSGLNVLLRRVEFITGLAYGTLSEVGEVEKTAEEVRASKQRSYSTVCDLQRELKAALDDTLYAMNVWTDIYSLAPGGRYSFTAEFDDSIAADRKAEFAEKMQLVTAGIMPMWEFRMWYFGEDETTAREALGDGSDLSS